VLDQAKRIVEAQLQPAHAPLTSAVPPGTTLRDLYLSERGEAFVDLSPEVSTAHPGGALNELLTVYSIVDALTTNLPAVTGVQILVNGREVDTLAGHVDLRRPLPKSLLMVQGG
jgi:spore germination protein GerM